MKHLFFTTIMLLWVSFAFGQLTGTKQIPGDYASLDAAITDLNTQGVGPGGVTIELLAGNPETAPAGGYVITASGNPNSPILIKGNTNTITSSNTLTAGALNDAIFKIIGGDYITIDGFVMQEDPANTTTTASSNNMTEFGVALFYNTPTDGPQHCTIKNNTIILGDNYQNAFGIYANSRHNATSMTTTNDITDIAGAFNNLIIQNNTISNVNLGIVLVGSTNANYMAQNIIVSYNDITFGRTGTFSSYVSVSGSVNGIYINNTLNVNVNDNTITCNGTNTAGTLRGIYHHATGTIPTTGNFLNSYLNNTITLTNGTTTSTYGIDINNLNAQFTTNVNNNTINNLNATGATTAVAYGIYQESASLNEYFNNNTFNLTPTTTGNVAAIYASNTIPTSGTVTANNNQISISKTNAGGIVYGYYSNASSPSGVVKTFDSNIFHDITLTGATTFYGFYENDGGAPTKTFSNNTFQNITGGTSDITAIYVAYGIHHIYSNIIQNISNNAGITGIKAGGISSTLVNTFDNTIANLTTSMGNINAINVNANGTNAISNVYQNYIAQLTANGATSTVSGITISAGTDINIHNNVISELYTPNASSATPSLAGIAALNGTNVNLYYNTVYLDATSTGTDFSTAALYATTTPTIKLINNILVNNSTPNGTGLCVAFQRAETSLTKYVSQSNNNLFYAGTPSATNVLYYDGTNAYQTLTDLQTAVTPRESASISELPPFVNTSVSPYDLHIQTTVATGIESGGQIITGIDSDIEGNIRYGSTGYTGTGNAPDIGAYEFEGIPNFTCTTPNPGNTIASNTSVCLNESIDLSLQNAIPGTGISYQWKKSTDGINYTNMPSANNPFVNGYVITEPTYFVCDVTCLNGPVTVTSNPVFVDFANKILTTTPATICGAGSANLEATATVGSTINWYDALTGGNLVGTGSPFTTPLISSTTSYYVAAETFVPYSQSVGLGANTSTSYESPFYHLWGGLKSQYLIRASELQAAGINQGPITSLGFEVVNVGVTYNDFNFSIGTTNSNALTTTFESGLTNVYSNAAYTLNAGTNTITFNTPFLWDGVSNIVVEFCWSNNNTGGTSATVKYDNTSFVSQAYYRADNQPSSTLCATATATSTQSKRPMFILNGQTLCTSPRVQVTATVTTSTPITISNDTSICNNGVATLEVINGTTSYDQFTWTPETNLYTDAACTVPYIAGTSATQVYMKTNVEGDYTYICASYNTSTSCGSTDTIIITVLPATVNLTANPPSICFSGSTQLDVTPTTGFGTATFQFAESTDGNNYTDIPGATGFTYTTGNLSSDMYYQWTAMVNTNICIQEQLIVNIMEPQVLSTTPGSNCGTGTVTLSATGSAGTTLYWYDAPTGGNLLGTGNTFITPIISSSTSYYVEAVIMSTCYSPRDEVVATITTPPAVSITSDTNNVCAGTPISLTAQSSNNDYTYTWSSNHNGQMITVSPTSSTTYIVTASDAITGCVTTDTINIDVNPLPVATATVDNATISCGQSVQLTAGELYTPVTITEDFNNNISFTKVNTSNGGTPANAEWTLRPDGYVYSGTTFHSNDNSQFIISNSDAQGYGGTTHTELISDVFSTINVDSLTFEMYHYYRHYSGSSAKVEIYDGIQWNTLQTWTATQGAESNFNHVVIPIPNTYLNIPNVQVRLVYDATWGYYWAVDNISLNLYNANTFTWSSTPLGFNSTLYNPTDAPVTTTQYDVVVTTVNGCTNTASVTVTVNNMPAPTVTVNNNCGESELIATNYTGSLLWSTNETTDTIIVTNNNPVSVTYTDGVCTSDAATVVPAPIEIPNTPTVAPIDACFGETVNPFVATSNYNDFVWYADAGLTIPIGTGSIYQSPEVNVGTYTYFVVAMNGTCTSDVAVAFLTIHTLPTASITQNGDTLISSSSTGNQWYNTLGPIAGATDSIYVVESEDDYYVVVTDANGCSTMSNIIHVLPTTMAQNQFASMISVSPNPAHNYTVLNMGTIDKAKIEIVAIDGKVVYNAFVKKNIETISLNGLATGLYTVKVMSNGKTIQKKLVVE